MRVMACLCLLWRGGGNAEEVVVVERGLGSARADDDRLKHPREVEVVARVGDQREEGAVAPVLLHGERVRLGAAGHAVAG